MKNSFRALVLLAGCILFDDCGFAQMDSEKFSNKQVLIGEANPALADVNRLIVVIIPPPSEPNTDGLVWNQLVETMADKLRRADVNIVAGFAGNVLEIPELRLHIDMLRLDSSQQYVFRIQTSLAKKVLLTENSQLHIKADIFETDPVMQVVSTADMPRVVIGAVERQVDTFISVWSVAKSTIRRPVDVSNKSFAPQKAEAENEDSGKGIKAEAKFVASKNSDVFHKPDCQFAQRISAKNLVAYGSREEAVNAGKRPCSRCKP